MFGACTGVADLSKSVFRQGIEVDVCDDRAAEHRKGFEDVTLFHQCFCHRRLAGQLLDC